MTASLTVPLFHTRIKRCHKWQNGSHEHGRWRFDFRGNNSQIELSLGWMYLRTLFFYPEKNYEMFLLIHLHLHKFALIHISSESLLQLSLPFLTQSNCRWVNIYFISSKVGFSLPALHSLAIVFWPFSFIPDCCLNPNSLLPPLPSPSHSQTGPALTAT